MRWLPFGVLVLAMVGYPLVHGPARAALVVVAVVVGAAASVAHALSTRGVPAGAALFAVAAAGLAVEAAGVASGLPFGAYAYSDALGPRVAGVPLVVPLAWTWMAWPAWLAAGRVVVGRTRRVALAGVGLAAWDLFLDPQMVAEGYWRWADPRPALPGVPGVPVSNYLGWLVVAVGLMALLHAVGGPAVRPPSPEDAPMLAMYLWTYVASAVAHAVFLGLPGSAAWGALGMGTLAVPLARACLP
jgi:putative membrane protein